MPSTGARPEITHFVEVRVDPTPWCAGTVTLGAFFAGRRCPSLLRGAGDAFLSEQHICSVCQHLQSWAESDLLSSDHLAGCCRGTFTSGPRETKMTFCQLLMGAAPSPGQLQGHVISS